MYKLVSVSDKTNIDVICKFFIEKGEKILSTGGTYNFLREKLPQYCESIIKVSDITEFPEILNGRVKTLHPKIFGGLLCRYDDKDHLNEIDNYNIPKINGVIVNLYPFQETVKKYNDNLHSNDIINQDIIENIDIGGVTLIRAAAKNYQHILTITNPSDYDYVIDNLTDNNLNKTFAAKAFNHISIYDNAISNYFNDISQSSDQINRSHQISLNLKYGCNPYQKHAGIYTHNGNNPFTVLNGKCGYINIIDAIHSWRLVKELSDCLDKPCAASFKHTSPAGVGTSKPLSDILKQIYDVDGMELSPLAIAFIRARNSDPMSSFGDFIALSHTVDKSTASLIKRFISDGVVAPDYTEEAMEILKSKRSGNYLVLKVDKDYNNRDIVECKDVFGITLVQSVNDYIMDKEKIGDIVTNSKDLDDEDRENLIIANISLKYAQSNNVSYAYDGQLIGLAAGQQNRVDCVRLAGEKSKLWWLRHHPKVLKLSKYFKDNVKRQERVNATIRYIQGDFTEVEYKDWCSLFTESIDTLSDHDKKEFINSCKDKKMCSSLASDAFFPFRDNIDFASKYNVKNIIQPGGSSADKTIIETCDKYGINMVFTGKRLFYH